MLRPVSTLSREQLESLGYAEHDSALHTTASAAAGSPRVSTVDSQPFLSSQHASLSVYDMGLQSLEEHHHHLRLTTTTTTTPPTTTAPTTATTTTGDAPGMLLRCAEAGGGRNGGAKVNDSPSAPAALTAGSTDHSAAAVMMTTTHVDPCVMTRDDVVAAPATVDVDDDEREGEEEDEDEEAEHATTTTTSVKADVAAVWQRVAPAVSTAAQQPHQRGSHHAEEEQHLLEQALHEPLDLAALHHSSYTTVCDTVSLIVCMVGLPGRGKSFISKRLVRYINWKGVPCRVFNAGNYRRQLLGVEGTAGADFFDPNNPRGALLREKMAELACEDLVRFIASHALAVGILDATNTTRKRRTWLTEYFQQEAGRRGVPYRLLFIESVCTDDTIVTENILRSKCDNDDFKNVKDVGAIIAEFRSRILQYEKVYETCEPAEGVSYIKIINVKHHVILHHVPNGLGSRIAFFLLNLHPIAFPIYVALPGETIGDRRHAYGGEERLTPRGEAYAVALKNFIQDRYVPHMVVLHATNYSVLSTLAPLMDSATEEETALSVQMPTSTNMAYSVTPTTTTTAAAGGGGGTTAAQNHSLKTATPGPQQQLQQRPRRAPPPTIFTTTPVTVGGGGSSPHNNSSSHHVHTHHSNSNSTVASPTTATSFLASCASVPVVVATQTSAAPPLRHGDGADPLTFAQEDAPAALPTPLPTAAGVSAWAGSSSSSSSSNNNTGSNVHGSPLQRRNVVFPAKHHHHRHHRDDSGDGEAAVGNDDRSHPQDQKDHHHHHHHHHHHRRDSSSHSRRSRSSSSSCRHTLPNTEAPVSKLHPYSPTTTIDELRAMAGGDLSVVPLPALRAFASSESDSQVHVTASASASGGEQAADSAVCGAAEGEAELAHLEKVRCTEPKASSGDGGGDDDNNNKSPSSFSSSSSYDCHSSCSSTSEEMCDEVLCPVPGLDNINYGRFSGHTAAWVKEKYPRLSAMLYDLTADEPSSSSTATTTGAAVAATKTDAASAVGNVRPRDVADTAAHVTGLPSRTLRSTAGGSSSNNNSNSSPSDWLAAALPAPVHYATHDEAVTHLQHAPTRADPRLSYCIQFPSGESCRQVNVRLEPALMAVMRTQSPVFVVAPAVPAQGILAFFLDVIPELSPTLRIPAGCVVEIGVKDGVTVHPLLPDALPASMMPSPVMELPELQAAVCSGGGGGGGGAPPSSSSPVQPYS